MIQRRNKISIVVKLKRLKQDFNFRIWNKCHHFNLKNLDEGEISESEK